MAFEVQVQSLRTDSLSLEYFKVPWDTELLQRPAAQLHVLNVERLIEAESAFNQFADWKRAEGIEFVTARVAHDNVPASWLLQDKGYRFIELNYRPRTPLNPIAAQTGCELKFRPARQSDQKTLCECAGTIFQQTRFHADPHIGAETADRRYANWMKNAFALDHQEVIVCEQKDELMAFFVQQSPAPGQVFWSLVGLAPGLAGKGLGLTVWTAALGWLAQQGIREVSTSISSLNAAVFRLYVKLGFSFPVPEAVFHWHAARNSSP